MKEQSRSKISAEKHDKSKFLVWSDKTEHDQDTTLKKKISALQKATPKDPSRSKENTLLE
jgi:hypothetical protein